MNSAAAGFDNSILVISSADHALVRVDTSVPDRPRVLTSVHVVGETPSQVAAFVPSGSSVGDVWVSDPQTKALYLVQYQVQYH